VRNVLIVYHQAELPVRSAVLEHLYSFRKYAAAQCYYLNAAVGGVPRCLLNVRFDLVIFHTTLLSTRWDLPVFLRTVQKLRALKGVGGVRMALPQDEFFHMDVVCDFINEFGITHVFSVAKPSEWPVIYRTVDRNRVSFDQVLTGYLSQTVVQQIERIALDVPRRTIDIGYRAWKAEPWLGRHGALKTYISDLFQARAQVHGLRVDISTRAEDTLYGDSWYRFLRHCRYTIGVEGGASLLDWNGGIRVKTKQFLAHHPAASFEEVEAACFPGLDGKLDLKAISPRHLEACATKTCQILIEGEYNGVLKSGVHYVPLKRDFSNLDQVLEIVKAETYREAITENAYRDIVDSGRYDYGSFVRFLMNSCFGPATVLTATSGFVWRWMAWRDHLSWTVLWLAASLRRPRELLVSLLIRSPWGRQLRNWKRLRRCES
jgi:hypothetical protein